MLRARGRQRPRRRVLIFVGPPKRSPRWIFNGKNFFEYLCYRITHFVVKVLFIAGVKNEYTDLRGPKIAN